MAITNHIATLCKELELDGLPQAEGGTYLLPLDDTNSIRIADINPGVYLTASLGPCPTGRKRGELFTLLMMSNLFGFGTSHAVLGLDARGEGCTLSFVLHDATDYRSFYDSLEEFLNQVDFWTEEIRGFQEG